eukprot:jgi/Chrzof1/9944/Cz04g21180.t1
MTNALCHPREWAASQQLKLTVSIAVLVMRICNPPFRVFDSLPDFADSGHTTTVHAPITAGMLWSGTGVGSGSPTCATQQE